MAQNQVINLENLIAQLQKNLKDIYIVEKEMIRLDQLLIAGKNTEQQIQKKLQAVNYSLKNYQTQQINLNNIREQSIKNGFNDLPQSKFTELQRNWQTQNPEILSIILKQINKYIHLSKHFYMLKNRTLRLVGMDKNFNYHFIDIEIPKTLNL
ncbi:hypothetical protein ACFL14_01750 [Patescibacteria group bacterium]